MDGVTRGGPPPPPPPLDAIGIMLNANVFKGVSHVRTKAENMYFSGRPLSTTPSGMKTSSVRIPKISVTVKSKISLPMSDYMCMLKLFKV